MEREIFVGIRNPFNPSVSVSALMTLLDFTLANARRFYSSMENPSDTEGLRKTPSYFSLRPAIKFD